MCNQIDRSTIPNFINKEILPSEEILWIVQPSKKIFILLHWINPINWFLSILLGGLISFPSIMLISESNNQFLAFLPFISVIIGIIIFFLYRRYLNNCTILVLTNKRIIGCLKPTLFTKDRLDLMIKKIEGIYEDETLIGNMLNYCKLRINTISFKQDLNIVPKNISKEFRSKFYSLHD